MKAAAPRMRRHAREVHGLVSVGRDEGTGQAGQGHTGTSRPAALRMTALAGPEAVRLGGFRRRMERD